MRLRNKKTGEIWETAVVNSYACGVGYRLLVTKDAYTQVGKHYDSLAELNEEWEDYEPKEPLIKDEKIRKAVRAWAEAIEVNEVVISYSRHDFLMITDVNADSDICFDYELGYTYNEDTYSIAELCGSEE